MTKIGNEAQPNKAAQEALRLHRLYRGKIQVAPKCPIRDPGDFSWLYTPGVAAPCLAIQGDPAEAYELTNKANLIAVVSDGSAGSIWKTSLNRAAFGCWRNCEGR